MYIKIMSDEDKPDGAVDKMHRMLQADSYHAKREEGRLWIGVQEGLGREWQYHEAWGNVYIMNDAGKTITSIAFTEYSQSGEPYSGRPLPFDPGN